MGQSEHVYAATLLTAAAATRHDPDAYVKPFARRRDDELPFDVAAAPRDSPVMLDTNFYILRAQRKVPTAVLEFVMGRTIYHCGVALGELSISVGILDPSRSATAAVRHSLLQLLASIALSDCQCPSPAAWAEAGLLAGILARTQLGLAKPRKTLTPAEKCCQEGRRRKVLNDVLLFLTAMEHGATLVSSNILDIDLLLRFHPQARVLLYRQLQ